MEHITLEELSRISDKAVHIDVSDHVRFLAKGVAEGFVINCKHAAQKGRRSYSTYAADKYVYNSYIFTDRNAITGGKHIFIEWSEFCVQNEESVDIIDDFIYAVSVFIKQAGISKVNIKKVPLASPPHVAVERYYFLRRPQWELVPVPSWYVAISAEW